jgi:hypothetical protein
MSARVPDYWVVDVDARVIERWSPDRATPLVERRVLDWRPVGARTPLTIDLPKVFEQIWSDYRSIGG